MKRCLKRVVMSIFLILSLIGTAVFSEVSQNPVDQGSGWYLTKYELVDGTGTYGSDKSSFVGGKNDMTMTHNRYDAKGTLLAGSTHQTTWADPPSFFKVGDTVSIQYETKQLSSKEWNMGSVVQQSINLDQGTGVSFSAADGTKYITKDFKGVLSSQKAIEAGKKDATRTIQMTIGRNYKVKYIYTWRDSSAPTPTATKPEVKSQGPGWYLKGYALKDGTGTYGQDKSSFKGKKNDMTMTHNRYDSKEKLVAGSTHQTIWTDPPSFLKVGQKISVKYETKQGNYKDWKMGSLVQQSVNMDQGTGVAFVATDGTRYITKDFKGTLTSQKAVEKGKKGQTRVIQLVIGRNYKATYTYEWRD